MIALVLHSALLAASPAAVPSYAPQARVAYIEQVLTALPAVKKSLRTDLVDYTDMMARTTCKSSFHHLRIECLATALQSRCQHEAHGADRQRCRLIADVAVTNKLAEPHLIPADERYDLMRQHHDFRAALRDALERRYGGMATALRLSSGVKCAAGDETCLARSIDSWCIAQADPRRLSWHYCVAALTWFIGTHSGVAPHD